MLDNFLSKIMQSLSVYARLFARAFGGTEAENILYNSLIRLSSSTSLHLNQTSTRLAITYPSSAIRNAVHLVTASSGYSNQDKDEIDQRMKRRSSHASKDQRTNQSNVYGDDAFFVTKHRLGDFLGKFCFSFLRNTSFRSIQVLRMVWVVGVNMELILPSSQVH